MSLLGFIGLVLLLTVFYGIYRYTKNDRPTTPDCNCKACQDFDTPEEPLTKQPKVYTTDCGECAWRHPSNCKECPITINKANLKRAEDDGVVYPDGEDEIEERRRLR